LWRHRPLAVIVLPMPPLPVLAPALVGAPVLAAVPFGISVVAAVELAPPTSVVLMLLPAQPLTPTQQAAANVGAMTTNARFRHRT